MWALGVIGLNWEILEINTGVLGVEPYDLTNAWDVRVLAVYHKCHEKFLNNVLEWFHHKQVTQIFPNKTLVRRRQRWEAPVIICENCVKIVYWINWLLALHIRLTVFEITSVILEQVVWQCSGTPLKLQNLF